MKLIIIIVGLLFGRFFSDFIQYRRFDWFLNHVEWMEKRLSGYGIWNSRGGVLLVLLLPSLAVLAISSILCEIFVVFSIVFSVIVLFLCLGHEQLTDQIEDYIEAVEDDDEDKQQQAAGLIDARFTENLPATDDLLGAVFNQSNRRIFAILFWFIVLGPLGALIYRLTLELYREQREIHGGFSESVSTLHKILDWPASRLTLLSYALVGNLVHTFEAWTDLEDRGLESSEPMLKQAGQAAIQYSESNDDVNEADWLDEAHGLINRSLLLWLTLIAFGTISGWLS